MCVGLPILLYLSGLLYDREHFAHPVMFGAIVYLPVAFVAWWRIRLAVTFDAFWHIGASFPFASALLLGGVFAFPQILGGSGGSFQLAVVGILCALVVGYLYVLIVSLGYCVLRRVGLVSNEFAV